MKIAQEKLLYYWLPLLIQILVLYNTVFIFLGLKYIYFIVMLVGILGVIFDGKKIITSAYVSFCYIYLYVILASTLVYLFDSNIVSKNIAGLTAYILPLFYWLLYYIKGGKYFNQIILGLKYPVLIIAILTFIQYYFSPNLFGVLNPTASEIVIYASERSFIEYAPFFRATSIFSSSQVFGLFIALYSIAYFILSKRQKNEIGYCIFLLLAGIHSGNKSFLLITFLFGLYYILKMKRTPAKIVIVISSCILLGMIIQLSDTIYLLDRVLNVGEIVEQEQTGRLSIYKDFFDKITLLGNGAGRYQNLFSEIPPEGVAESYYLQLLLELGLFSFILFILILPINIFIHNQGYTNVMLCFICLSMIFVHAFNAYAFFIFWGFFFFNIKISESYSTNLKLK